MVTYGTLIHAICDSKQNNEAIELLKRIIEGGIVANIIMYILIIFSFQVV